MGRAWQRFRIAVHGWWEGEYVSYDNHPNSPLVFIGGEYHRHWTARWAQMILGFLGREWKWAVGFAVAVASLLIAYARLS